MFWLFNRNIQAVKIPEFIRFHPVFVRLYCYGRASHWFDIFSGIQKGEPISGYLVKGNGCSDGRLRLHVDVFLCQVVQGLIKVVTISLATLNQQMSQAYIAKQQLPPMLELEMHLSGDKVSLAALCS